MSRIWRWLIPGYLTTLPAFVLSLIYALVICRAGSWRFHDGIVTCVAGTKDNGRTRIWGEPDAQTWMTWLTVFRSERERDVANLRVHEAVHTWQGFIGGTLGILVGGLVALFIDWRDPSAHGLWLGGLGGGLLVGAAYFASWLWHLARTNEDGERPGWYDDYRRIPFERHAYEVQDDYIRDGKQRWGA